MKRFFYLIFSMFLTINPLLALNEDIIFSPNDKQKEDMFEKPIILEPSERAPEEKVSPYTKQALRAIITKDYDLNSSKGMFDRQLSAEFHRGIIKNTTFHTHVINTLGESISDSDNDFTNNVQLINVGLSGKFKGEKENYSVLFDLTPNVFEDFSHGFILDAFIESGRIKNNTILVGASRPQVGYEGGNSAKTIPFLMRSQTARTFSNVRKTGIKVDGKYKWVDYEVGGFSSDVRYYEFFPGVEGNLWIDLKPLANIEEKYGKLYVGGGISKGERNSVDFQVVSSAIRYYREKFWMLAEFQQADGSNGGGGLTTNEAYGYNLTLAYRLTKKLEFLLRYDDFDSNKSIKNNNTKEYTAGINWYILGQCARVMLNYIYCDNEARENSHRILLGTQFVL